jgi:two-component system, NtrC family, sensor kinase
VAPVPPALAVVADVASRLASAPVPGDVLPGVLEAVRAAFAADECVIWLRTPSELLRAWSAGAELTARREVTNVLEGDGPPADHLTVARLHTGDQQVGALTVRMARPPAADERVVITTLANMLAPILSNFEYSHQLEEEVEAGTRVFEEQQRFIEKIVDSLPLGLYVIDREYRIRLWNRKRETGMQGVAREEALGRTIFDILHRQPAHLLRAEFDDVFSSGRIAQFDMESTVTGDRRTYRISKIPMRMDGETVTHVITIGEDVTDWRESQERFSQAEKLAAVGQLASGVMHEINNPLATIAACAESLTLRFEESGTGAPGDLDYLRLIDGEVQRCKRIVDTLLDFSRPRRSEKVPTDVNAVIDQTLFLLKHHPRFKLIEVRPELDPAIGNDVRANAEQLVQVFMSLLINAMDAMAERGTIVIRTRRGRHLGEAVIAEVIDQGHGIPRSEVTKIFEPFYTTKAPGRGTGLGLSICYSIIADHGGRIEVDSTPGQGSTFRILLPAGPVE